MGRRAFLYPFDISFAEIFKYKEQICISYDTIYPVVAQGLPYENMDVGIICKDRKWHATVCSDYRELLSSCTDAIITNDSSDSMEAMRIAISHNLNVVCLFPFRSRDIEQSVLQMCEKKGVSYTNYSSIQNYSYDHKNLEGVCQEFCVNHFSACHVIVFHEFRHTLIHQQLVANERPVWYPAP